MSSVEKFRAAVVVKDVGVNVITVSRQLSKISAKNLTNQQETLTYTSHRGQASGLRQEIPGLNSIQM